MYSGGLVAEDGNLGLLEGEICESLLLMNGVATERLAQEYMPVGLVVLIHILLKSLRNL